MADLGAIGLNKNYKKYYSINRTVVINRGEFFLKCIGRFKTGSVDATSIYNGFSAPCNVISY